MPTKHYTAFDIYIYVCQPSIMSLPPFNCAEKIYNQQYYPSVVTL